MIIKFIYFYETPALAPWLHQERRPWDTTRKRPLIFYELYRKKAIQNKKDYYKTPAK